MISENTSETYKRKYSLMYTGVEFLEYNQDNLLDVVDVCRWGDSLIFFDINSIGEKDNLCEVCNSLIKKGLKLSFEKSPQCNSECLKILNENKDVLYDGKIFPILYKSYQEMLDNDKKYLRASREVASKSGTVYGRTPGIKSETKKAIKIKDQIIKLSRDFDGDYSDIELLDMLDVSRKSYYKYKKELREDQNNLE